MCFCNPTIRAVLCNNCYLYVGSLKSQVEKLTEERDRLKTVPMKYRRMTFNAELQEKLSAAHTMIEQVRLRAESGDSVARTEILQLIDKYQNSLDNPSNKP